VAQELSNNTPHSNMTNDLYTTFFTEPRFYD
jgi:hypothetical protein